MRPLGLALAFCVLLAPSARPRAEGSGGSPARTQALLDELDAALKPLRKGDYTEQDRRPALDILIKLRVEAGALLPPDREFENAAAEALRQESAFWRSAPRDADVFPAASAEPLERRAAELAGLFSKRFPRPGLSPAGPSLTAPATLSATTAPDSAVKAAASGKGAAADPNHFFDGSGTRRGQDPAADRAGAAGGGLPRPRQAKKGIRLQEPLRVSDLALDPVPAPRPEREAGPTSPATGAGPAFGERPKELGPSVPPAEAACREASGGGFIAGLCRSPATAWSAPMAVGLLDAMKQQFGTVSGAVSLLAFTALGLLLSALSGGVGLLATLIKALCGIAVLWTVVSMVRRVAAAIREFASTRSDDPRHWRALREIGKVGGELLIIVLMAFAGFKLGERPAVKKAVGSMLEGLKGTMTRIGVRPAAPAPELRAAFAEPAAAPAPGGSAGSRSNLVPPEPPPPPSAGAALTASGRSLSNPKSLQGATAEEVASLIPKGWVTRPMRTGRGTIYEMPGTRGADIIQISRGNPRAPDPLHQGPYVKISRAGETIRVELKP